MATEPEQIPVTNPDEGETERVTFDERQQKRVNEIIKDRLERQRRRDAERYAEELTAACTALEARIRAELAADSAERDAERLENEDIAAELETERKRAAEAEAKAREIETESENLTTETEQLRKDTAILAELQRHQFIDPDVVKTLTESKFEWSDKHQQYIVRDSSGHIRNAERIEYIETSDPSRRRIKSVTQVPMTICDFYEDYGRNRPYLLRGCVKGGTGSSESTHRLGLPCRKSAMSLSEKCRYIESHGLAAWTELPS